MLPFPAWLAAATAAATAAAAALACPVCSTRIGTVQRGSGVEKQCACGGHQGQPVNCGTPAHEERIVLHKLSVVLELAATGCCVVDDAVAEALRSRHRFIGRGPDAAETVGGARCVAHPAYGLLTCSAQTAVSVSSSASMAAKLMHKEEASMDDFSMFRYSNDESLPFPLTDD